MILPTIILYCGYRGVAAGLGDHNYAEGINFFVGYLLFVILKEVQREARTKYRQMLKNQTAPPP